MCSPQSSTAPSGSSPRQIDAEGKYSHGSHFPPHSQQQNCRCQQQPKSVVGQTQCRALMKLGCRGNTARLAAMNWAGK